MPHDGNAWRRVTRVTVIGAGLLGGSIGLGLRAAGFRGEIVGVGRRQASLDEAEKRGCIDRGVMEVGEAFATTGAGKSNRPASGKGSAATSNDETDARVHLVILATPLGTFESLFAQLAPLVDQRVVVTDVGSTKQQVCDWAKAKLGDRARRFVGAHPMAGSELHGPAHAQAELFRDRLCILTPAGTGSDDDALAVVRGLWETLGMTITEKTPGDHDQLVAAISHLPHAVAVLLVQLADRAKAISVGSTGFRDTTRVASGDPRVWTDIFTTNREAVLASLDEFADALAAFRAVVDEGDAERMHKLLEEAKAARDTWLKVK